MPRIAREKSKTGIYHIVLRGINKEIIFKEEIDYIRFIETLKKYKEKSGYKIYGYCIMPNHIHLLLKEGEEGLGITMRRIGASYVYWYNWKYERIGHLFQDRYKSKVVEDNAYLLTVLRYIHQNPLEAKMGKTCEDYKWSSYKEYIGKNRLIDKDFILNIFHQNRKKGIEEFKAFHKNKEETQISMGIDKRKAIKDDEAMEIIKELCQVDFCKNIKKLKKNQRDILIKQIKEKGLSSRQIARLTGISRNVVLKA